MRTLRYLTVLTLLLAGLAVSVDAQRTRRPAPRATPKPTPARTPVSTFEASIAKQKVSNQLHNVNAFVERLGEIGVAIENADRAAAARTLKPADIDKNNSNKRKTVDAIRILRLALVDLETEFRAKPALATYLPRIQGISTLASQSEDHAIAGRFVAAKDPLRQVALKLNETLAVMPGQLVPGSVTTASPNRTIPVSTTPATGRPAGSQSATAARRDPATGMSIDQVLQSSWGAPANKRTSNTATGTTEVWTYSGNRTIYFYNGKVTRIVP